MGFDKHSSKGGFLQLFDWNGKSRKKLFSNKSDLPEGLKQGKRSCKNFPMTRYHTADDEDDIGGSSVKGSSDYSCASSVTDEEGHGVRAPNVVARLMGLDSLPTSNATEPYSTQFFDTRSLENAPIYRRTPESYNLNGVTSSGDQFTKLDALSRNSMEPKLQKMQSKPFDTQSLENAPIYRRNPDSSILSRVPSSGDQITKVEALSRNSVDPKLQKMQSRLYDTRSLENAPSYRRTTESYNLNRATSSGDQLSKLEALSRISAEPKVQKMQLRPFERFQTETLPPKSAKSIPITHNKLLSPIKSPGFRSNKNAAHIMAAAAKILEPRTQISAKGKQPSLRSSSVPVKVRDLKDRMEAAQRPSSSHSDVSRRTAESNAFKQLKGQSLNKSWNGSEDTPKFRSSPDSEVINSSRITSKGKSISLAIQAKVNVQRREGLSASSKGSLIQKEHHDSKSNQPPKSEPKPQKNILKKSTSVLTQNNQKQNCSINKDRLPSKPSSPNNNSGKTVSGNSFSKNRISNKVAGNSVVGSNRAGLGTGGIGREVTPRRKNAPQKSRLTEGNLNSKRVEAVSDDKDERPIRSSMAQDGHLKWTEDDRRKGMDVVSFTFTSPMIKPAPAFQSSTQLEKYNSCCEDSRSKICIADSRPAKLSSVGVNVIGGDPLSILLEQKLKELADRDGSSRGNSVKAARVTSASFLENLMSSLNAESTTLTEHKKRSELGLHTENLSDLYGSNISSSRGQMLKMNQNMQVSEESGECCSTNSEARKEFDERHPSPMSIFEPSFSYDSFSSSDSPNESQRCSSTLTEQTVDTTCGREKLHGVEAEMELSDSASSTLTTTLDEEHVSKPNNWEMEYVREVLCNVELMFKDFSLGRAREIINPHLFHQLENRKTKQNKGFSLRRKELFDCISEYLDLRCRRYVGGGCKTWVKGVAMVQRTEWLVEEVYREISGWGSMGDWMVDELVDNDMSTQYGRWLDYEIEQSEVGLEIERSILNSLVNEVVFDIVAG